MKPEQSIATLQRDYEALREAAEALLVMVTGEAEGGKLTGMGDLQKRLAWYEELHPLVDALQQALSKPAPAVVAGVK